MCKWCQNCLESCYWHLIEKRFCFDESIALYSEPVTVKEEKNNNLFDNMAFYDSVSVIAGRAVVTIDPLPEKKKNENDDRDGTTLAEANHNHVIVQQPKRLTWQEHLKNDRNRNLSRTQHAAKETPEVIKEEEVIPEPSIEVPPASTPGTKPTVPVHEKTPPPTPMISIPRIEELKKEEKLEKGGSIASIPCATLESPYSEDEDAANRARRRSGVENRRPSAINKSLSCSSILDLSKESEDTLDGSVELRKKSLAERRLSRSLYLKIDYPKEVPIIRQSSVPKFYLDTPEQNQTESSLIKTPLTSLTSPVICDKDGFCFDLKSVVEMQKLKQLENKENPHRESWRLAYIKEKIKLKKSKSTLSANNLPYTNHM